MDRLQAMDLFVAAATAGSFSAASRELRTPLPTVSRKIADLETHLHAKLFVRSTRKLALTEVGHAYLAACKRILEEVAEADRSASGQYNAPQGELIVTAPMVFGRLHVLPVVAEFLAGHPRVDVRLVQSDRHLSLIDEHLDVAVRIGKLPDSGLVATQLGTVRRVVCASPAYLEAHGTPKSLEQLEEHACVTFPGLGGAYPWVFRGDEPTRVRSRFTVNTAAAAIAGAVAGVGLTRVLSYQVANEVARGELALVLKKFEPEPIPVSLVYVRERRLTAKLRAFIDYATPKLRERLRASAH
ncbi:MAG TPA: LysR substrate-binding domain-containing protein [Gammaproteobacteria bacterium]|nr:LysR substrate-binding domain-containing protein [Gammaproteobacteria bacterium]